jgi:hypothetical protein
MPLCRYGQYRYPASGIKEIPLESTRSALFTPFNELRFLLESRPMFLQHLLNGVTIGSGYALIALGYTLVYGVLKQINFAHGEISPTWDSSSSR